MTYISRKERLIAPRWLDECDAEYKLRASRKRSEGRLKRHISCDDLRAWVNNNYIKNEHFLDLMSDGEATGKNRVRLYGRYIPVPVLIKLVQSVTDRDLAKENLEPEEVEDEETVLQEFESYSSPKSESNEIEQPESEIYEDPKKKKKSLTKENNKSGRIPKKKTQSLVSEDSKADQISKKGAQSLGGENNKTDQIAKKRAESLIAEDNKTDDSLDNQTETSNETNEKADNNDADDYGFADDNNEFADDNENADSFLDTQGEISDEKNASEKIEPDNSSLERRLVECATLLGRAIGKLERIDNIASLAIAEVENAENEELKMNFDQSKSNSSSGSENHQMQFDLRSKMNVKRARDSVKYMELLRKISCLRQKLKKIQDCRMKINEQMRMQREAKFCSNHQVTELYSRREQAKVKRLQRKLEKLISTKGKLLSELTDAVSCLNKLKRSASRSRSTIFSKPDSSRISFDQDENFQLKEPVPCACGCQCSDNNLESSESEKYEFSDSVLSETYYNGNSLQQDNSYLNSAPEEIPKPSSKTDSMTDTQEHFYYPNKDLNHKDKEKNSEYKSSSPAQFFSPQESMHAESPTNRRSMKPELQTGLRSMKPELQSGLRSMKPESPTGSRSMKSESPNGLKLSPSISKADTEETLNKSLKSQKKSKIKFVCPENPCKNNLYSEDLEYYQPGFNKPVQHNQNSMDSKKSNRLSKAMDPIKSGRSSKAMDSTKSGRPSKAMDSTKSGRSSKAVDSTKSGRSSKAVDSMKSGRSSKAIESMKSEKSTEVIAPQGNKRSNKVMDPTKNSRFNKAMDPSESGKYSKIMDSSEKRRPNTSPIDNSLRHDFISKTPARKFRSETTMKEIEKALRNYDQRLNTLESLENKIEKLREKLSDSNKKKHKLLIERDEGKKQKAVEWEKSNREITKLCSENWELKIQVQKLAAKSDVQYRKLQALKSNKKKVKELESEAEDLKKELSEYQDSFQDQRKCINMLESVVAVQRTEIEKLMNLIKKLTTMDKFATCCQERRNVQRSRSYSPESRKPKRTYCRPKINRCNASSDEDFNIICCEDYYQHEMRKNHQKNFDRRFCSPEPIRRLGWCVN